MIWNKKMPKLEILTFIFCLMCMIFIEKKLKEHSEALRSIGFKFH